MHYCSQGLKSGIYQITNWTNGKIYIGSAINLRDRWLAHKSYFRRDKHQNSRFQRAWNKYSETAFTFHIIEYCKKEKLIEREQYWLDKTKCYDPSIGYNNRKIADSALGTKRTLEAKARMSKAAKLRLPMSEQTKLKISITKKGNSPVSEETKRKMSIAGRLTEITIKEFLNGRTIIKL